MNTISFQRLSDVPAPPDGYSLVTKSVANDGSLLFLSIERAGADAVREREANGMFPKTKMKDARRFSLCRVWPNQSQQTIELPELDVTFPLIEVFPNGKILVVGARS